jgi:adenylate cyclase
MTATGTSSPVVRFLSELRRRRVIRVAVVYAIAGWIVIEVASTMLPGLNLPAWTVTLVIALVVLGFPIAFLMGWMFDIGPGGMQRTEPGPAAAEVSAQQATAVMETAVAVDGKERRAATAPNQDVQPMRSSSLAENEGRRTIAVLPFVNMSGESENEYFSDGISEEILNLLTKLPQLKVASRTSSFSLKGEKVDIPTAARQLGVGTILEGSVRRAGERVRITAQLIEADSDSHLWSETYDREMKDVFAIQDDIAQSIVKALQVTLSPQERRAMQSVATSDPEAYDYYLRGRNYMYSMARRDYEHAIRMFEQAIKLDSKYALAYAGLADAYSHMYRYVEATVENVERANRASEQAVVLDRDSAEAHASRGMALFISERYDEAEAEFETAIARNPNLFEAWYYYGLASSSQGRIEKAAQLYTKASEVNPADFQVPMFLAMAYASMGQKQEEMRVRLGALGTLERHLKLNPHDTRAIYFAAQNLYRIGEKDKAVVMAEQAMRQGMNEPVVLYNVACFYTGMGDKERAIDLLEQAVDQGWGDRAWMENDSDLVALHEEPRFVALLSRLH